MTKPPVRQPIVAVLGHVDHGKTSLLDRIRGSRVTDRESGGITQHIGATEVPLEAIRETCGPLMEGKQFDLPGLLFIDTPGHRAFTTLRSRGGALADIAILVVDINEGLMPQTIESIRILRQNKTPFIIAANKVDRLPNFDTEKQPNKPFVLHDKELKDQDQDISAFEQRYWELLGKLSEENLPAERYDKIRDFTKTIGIVPCSAHTGLGLPDLLLILTGLAQRFLQEKLEWHPEGPADATLLEIKEVQGLGPCADVILRDGHLEVGETVVIGGKEGPITTTIKALLRPAEMAEIRTTAQQRFAKLEAITSAAGVRIAAPGIDDAMAGSPLRGVGPDEDLDTVVAEVAAEQKVRIEPDDEGVLLKADTLGSLEALAFELRDAEHGIAAARVGDVSKRDVMEAANYDKEHRAILAFNVRVLPDAAEAAAEQSVHVIDGDIIYRLVEDLDEWQQEQAHETEEDLRKDLVFPGKLLFLQDHTFRVSKPAIVGVRVLAGRVRVGHRLVRDDGRTIGRVRSLRDGDQSLAEAKQGQEIACAIEGPTVGRQIEEGMVMFVDMPESHFRDLRDHPTLTHDEKEVMNELQGIKKLAGESPFWGL